MQIIQEVCYYNRDKEAATSKLLIPIKTKRKNAAKATPK